MKNQKKLTILLGSILGVLVLTLGITFAVFTYQQTGTNNQQLVLGDIYMHYNETNQLKMENAMPGGGLNKISTYTPNPIMANQEIVENELYECVNYLSKWSMAGKSLNDLLDNNSTVTSFCQGTGTLNGHTFQELLFAASNVEITEMLSLNIIQEDGGSYIVNPNIATQTINELSLCVSDFNSNVQLPIANMLDQGSTMETFCQGTGTASGVDINSWGTIFILQFKDTKLLDDNVFFKNDIYYTDVILNPIMQTEETGTGILGKCESYFADENFDEGTTATSFCRGSGTSNGKTLLELSDDNDMVKNVLLSYELIMPKIDLPYFEFTISGKNTYSKKDIYYDVVLNHGDTPENRNTRIEDEFLRFALYEVLDDNTEKNIFLNKNYSSLENKRIHVETIPKNTMNEINKTYRLYMWIDENVVIGNVDEDYTIEEWNDIFASIKVNVSGGFNEKALDASCFNYEIENNEVILTGYNTTCGNKLLIPSKIEGLNVTTIKEMAFTNSSIKEVNLPSTITTIEANAFKANSIKNVSIPNSVTYLHCQAFDSSVSISKSENLVCDNVTPRSCFTAGTVETYEVNENMTEEELNSCVNYLTTIWGVEEEGNTVNTGETYKDYCQGTGIIKNNSFVYDLNIDYAFSDDAINYFQENNITKTTLGAAITDYDASCGSDVVIPDTIDGYKVTVIDTRGGSSIITPLKNNSNALKPNNLLNRDKDSNILPVATSAGAFSDKNLTSVILPNTLQVIKGTAFFHNQLTSLTIPNSVTIINYQAFSYNQLTSVIFEANSNLDYIGNLAFTGDNHTITEVTIPDSVTYLSCIAFNDDVIINKRANLVCVGR